MEVGKHTYGSDNIAIRRYSPTCKDKVIIGKFCSIAINIVVMLDANHLYDRPSTFPFSAFGWCPLTPENKCNYSNGNVIIGNDVWIGSSSTINSGLTIGDGAIIATNSHVVKNIEPYSIVGGNPAQHIKYRFNDQIIKQLLEIKWWDLNDEQLKTILPFFFQTDIQLFINKVKNISK